ncbi:MAG: hypothetical protein PVG35_04120 [Desulfobacterales bacterium]|jgi:hypothetical protein
MCESYKTACVCRQKTAEIFFGKMVLTESSVTKVFCPECSQDIDAERADRVWDNDWILELDMDVLRTHAASMGIAPQEVTAAWVFDQGYATWVGITPDDTERRNQERAEIQKLAKTDIRAYYEAMKKWGLNREKKFMAEGWRKMKAPA